ncbi:MAG: Fic family protein [Cellulomonadaceae bacterium]
MLYDFPSLDREDSAVLAEIAEMRSSLAENLRVPRRWTGRLRRTALARSIRGSNSIEGYNVELDDADASLDGDEPLSADERTFAEIRGYRQALGYVLTMSKDTHFGLDTSALRSMHFMLLSHDLSKSPGSYRTREIYVHDERTEQIVYTGPEPELVASLMGELVTDLASHEHDDPTVVAAMAHLNLVMIHPFRDGNGRMARALQTLALATRGIADPEFASIEEWLGANTEDYYRVLAATGAGAWAPQRDAHLWVKFNLRAHHLQAQTVRGRWRRAQDAYGMLDALVATHGLPDRVVDLLYTALLGFRLRRPTYVKQSGVDARTASRDFRALSELGLLRPIGETKGRHYLRGTALEEIRLALRAARTTLEDPFPWMAGALAEYGTGRGTARLGVSAESAGSTGT